MEQERIPVGWVPPTLPPSRGVSVTETPRTETSLPDKDPRPPSFADGKKTGKTDQVRFTCTLYCSKRNLTSESCLQRVVVSAKISSAS